MLENHIHLIDSNFHGVFQWSLAVSFFGGVFIFGFLSKLFDFCDIYPQTFPFLLTLIFQIMIKSPVR